MDPAAAATLTLAAHYTHVGAMVRATITCTSPFLVVDRVYTGQGTTLQAASIMAHSQVRIARGGYTAHTPVYLALRKLCRERHWGPLRYARPNSTDFTMGLVIDGGSYVCTGQGSTTVAALEATATMLLTVIGHHDPALLAYRHLNPHPTSAE